MAILRIRVFGVVDDGEQAQRLSRSVLVCVFPLGAAGRFDYIAGSASCVYVSADGGTMERPTRAVVVLRLGAAFVAVSFAACQGCSKAETDGAEREQGEFTRAAQTVERKEQSREQRPPSRREAPASGDLREGTNGSPCAEDASVRMARAYLLSAPISNGSLAAYIDHESELTQYVKANLPYFKTAGASTRCASAFSQRLLSAGVQASDPAAGNVAIERWGAQAPEIAVDAARQISSSGGNLLAMALELQWLAEVLPSVAAGDLRPFNTTGTVLRKQVRAIMPLLRALGPGQEKMLTDELRKAQSSLAPAAEAQIARMAQAMVQG